MSLSAAGITSKTTNIIKVEDAWLVEWYIHPYKALMPLWIIFVVGFIVVHLVTRYARHRREPLVADMQIPELNRPTPALPDSPGTELTATPIEKATEVDSKSPD